MKRNLKALGLALLAAFAMSAVAVSAAQATQAQFTAAEYPAVGTGTEIGGSEANFIEMTPGRTFSCSTISYEATLTEASSSLTVTPHYTNCTTNDGITINFDLNGCHFEFTAGTKKAGGSTGATHIRCPVGSSITTTIATCTIHIPPQSIPLAYTNEGEHLKVTVNYSGLTATETDGFLCPFEGNTHVTAGKFVSTLTLDGYQDLGTHHWITKDPDGSEVTKATNTEGEKKAVSVS